MEEYSANTTQLQTLGSSRLDAVLVRQERDLASENEHAAEELLKRNGNLVEKGLRLRSRTLLVFDNDLALLATENDKGAEELRDNQRDAPAVVTGEPIPQDESKPLILQERLRFPYGRLFLRKLGTRAERRQIIAFVVAAAFLLFTFWNSFDQKRLQRDLEKATIDKTLNSGKISVGSSTDYNYKNTIIFHTEINANGRPIIAPGTPIEISSQLERMHFDPPKLNGHPVHVRVPIIIGVVKTDPGGN